MASLIEAIDIKRKMFFEYENAPYHCIDVEVSRPTARGGQTLVRLKMRNLLTRAVFDKTFKAGEKFSEPDLVKVKATYLYADNHGYNFMDQDSYETVTLTGDTLGGDRLFLVDNLPVGYAVIALVVALVGGTWLTGSQLRSFNLTGDE